MIELLIYLAIAAVFLFFAISIGNVFISLCSKLFPFFRLRILKSFLSTYDYHCYYLTDKDIKIDPRANIMSTVYQSGYVSRRLDSYMERIDETHLPLKVLINWTRTIAEDLQESSSPVIRVHSWEKLFQSSAYRDRSEKESDYILFSDIELAYLWGGISFWLRYLTDMLVSDDLNCAIADAFCKKRYLLPYFRFCMRKESIEKIQFSTCGLRTRSTSQTFNVQGDFVMEKYVGCEIGNGKNGGLQINSGRDEPITESDKDIKVAIESLLKAQDDNDGFIFRNKKQWWAVYKVLSTFSNYPKQMTAFGTKMKELKVDEVDGKRDYSYESLSAASKEVPQMATCSPSAWSAFKDINENYKQQYDVAEFLMLKLGIKS